MEHENTGDCGRGDCGGGCFLCTLFVCKHCGLFEGSITTDCPGVESGDKGDDIYAGKLDFRAGQWVPEKNPTNQSWERYAQKEAAKREAVLDENGMGYE